ncbi:hypothetical protein PV08_11302 [Exophiala spinifera]|uniref:MYND-type domain-containing protein n=1 Tax=Exophiala spinifera TaxID=91928 RepID=A0A0D2AV21_9EURO|nr:uncharacterized protein PV08_11302 [Exophiala spinifera]KIW10340.1 hypothetical protein PV08_11302 [Exophiala spinifera]
MLTPQVANVLTFFYPLGNTPAVSLTQALPPEKQADILLLGSGDIRHILFTVHTERTLPSGRHESTRDACINGRTLDFTCCDVDQAIIARNILLLTLIIDDVDGTNVPLNWNLYYHFRIDEASLRLLQSQARKLHTLADSLETWHKSTYGMLITPLDHGSLERVKDMWNFYSMERKEKERAGFEAHFDTYIQKSRQRKSSLGIGLNLTGFRSACPAAHQSIEDLGVLHDHYWEHGTLDVNQSGRAPAGYANPMFLSLDDKVILHYGTDPLLGFHLAMAFVPMRPASPLLLSSAASNRREHVVAVAKAEFDAWTASFRRHADSVKLRFFVGDALALSYSLQRRNPVQSPVPTQVPLYRDRFHFEPLTLDGKGDADRGAGPSTFTVIDTSNLIDHVGALNLLAATAPLLAHDISAILYTEKLARSDSTFGSLFDRLLCGPLPTVSILLGLTPAEFVTNTSALSTGDELFLDSIIHTSGQQAQSGQLFTRTAWKQPIRTAATANGIPSTRITFGHVGLASILYHVYLRMFENEDITTMMSNATLLKLQQFSVPKYHRASFAALIGMLRMRVITNWEQTVEALLELVESNNSHLMTRNYIQELFVWLHLLGVYSVKILKAPCNSTGCPVKMNDLRDWKNIPPVVCVTLKVPRDQLVVFTEDHVTKTGTPPLHCLVQGSSLGRPWQNAFGALQGGFGQVETRGTRFSDEYEVGIIEDQAAWSGTSPLWVSFYAPTWMLLLEPRTASVKLGIQTTPQSTQAFIPRLGLDLTVFQTCLSDTEHVHISKCVPNQTATRSVCKVPASDAPPPDGSDSPAIITTTTITAVVDSKTAKVTSLAARLGLVSPDCQRVLQAGGQVSAASTTPFHFAVDIRPGCTIAVDFPLPMLDKGFRIKVARKSGWVELTAPVVDAAEWPSLRSFIYPVFLDSDRVTNWNLPYLNIHSLPVLDEKKTTQLAWLTTHASMMWSASERSLRNNPHLPASLGERTRVELKDSMFSLYMHYSGLQGRRARIFGVSCPSDGGVHILFFVSSLRLDLSNRTAVLDTAVLPLHDTLMPRIRTFLGALTTSGSLCQVRATKAELCAWKQVLPALVERCRTWSHRSGCEYLAEQRVPLSVENGQPPLCSCGEGIMPPGFITGVPEWDQVAKYAVRAAISPPFSAAMFEGGCKLDMLNQEAEEHQAKACNSCGRDEAVNGSGLLSCARCRKVRYCSKECQRVDWKKHKANCVPI